MEVDIKTFKVGQRVKGTVISVEKEEGFLDIGAFCDAKIDKQHYSYETINDLRSVIGVNDELETMITYVSDEQILLSRLPFEKDAQFAEIKEKMAAGETLNVSFERFNRGGLEHKDIFTYFMPASQIGIKGAEPKDYVNKPFEVLIVDVNENRQQFIVSARKVKDAKYAAKKAGSLEALANTEIASVKVTNVVEAGVEVRFDDMIRGFIPRNQLSHLRFTKVSDLFEIGQIHDAKVIEVRPDGQFIGSFKATQATPWEQFLAAHKVDDTVAGTVKRITDFGAFVEIIPGVEGLLHKSEVSYDEFANYRDFLTENETINVKIININEKDQRLSLSIKRLNADPWATLWERFHEGDIIPVTVRRIENKHMWVEVEQYVYALLYRRETLVEENQELSDVYKEGETLEAKITELNPKRRRIVVSLAAIIRDAEAKQLADYRDKLEAEDVTETGALKGKFARLVGGDDLAHADNEVFEEADETK
jgi:small subunit ribosomal protein S1